MKILKKISLAIAIATTLSTNTFAATGSFAVGPRVGVQGFGFDVRTPFSENIFGRVGFNYFKYTKTFDDGQIKLKGKLDLITAPIMLDWHPFDRSGFRLSAGIAYNGNRVKVTGTPSGIVTLEGQQFTPAQIGSVTAKVKFRNAIASVATVGYDSSFINNSPWSFNVEAGLMYTGKPKLSVSSTGDGGALVAPFVKKDGEKTLKDLRKFLEFYPVLSIGMKYTF